VDELALYETVREPLPDAAREAVLRANYLTFTSSSTVTHFLDSVGGKAPAGARIVSIGPVTTRTLKQHGLQAHVEASRHDVEGLLAALLADAARSG
jgi:uroporphyrinogen-III synthase